MINVSHLFVCLPTLKLIPATGVLNKNKLSKCNIAGDKRLQDKGRGHFALLTAAWLVGTTYIRAVYIAFPQPSELNRLVRRWNKVERKYIQEQQPNEFYHYNQNMSFNNRMDENVAKYRIAIRMKK